MPGSQSRKSGSKRLLKAALTKNLTSNNESSNGSLANNTAVGLQKAQKFFDHQKETPRTILAEVVSTGNVLVADDLFNAAKAATRARRELTGRSSQKRKNSTVVADPLPSLHHEGENFDPLLASPLEPGPQKLKRKVHAAVLHNVETDSPFMAESHSMEDTLEPSVSENQPQLVRRVTRASAPALVANKRAYLKELENIRHAPTPVIANEDSNNDLRKTDKMVKAIDMEEDFSFHPYVESTRVGLQQFDEDGDDEESEIAGPEVLEPQGSPKASSRKRSASRLKSVEAVKHALVDEEDRGSYIERNPQLSAKSISAETSPVEEPIEEPAVENAEVESTEESSAESASQPENDEEIVATVANNESRKASQELMPPPKLPLQVMSNKTRETLPKPAAKRSKFSKEEKMEARRRKSLVEKFESITNLKVSREARDTLVESVDKLVAIAMTRLTHQTNGLPPKLGDWKDMFVHFGFIPADDHRNRHLNAILRKNLDYEHFSQLVNLPLLDGSGKDTIVDDIWNQRAIDMEDDLPPPNLYGAKRKKRSRKTKKL